MYILFLKLLHLFDLDNFDIYILILSIFNFASKFLQYTFRDKITVDTYKIENISKIIIKGNVYESFL